MRTLLPLGGPLLAALQTCAPPAFADHETRLCESLPLIELAASTIPDARAYAAGDVFILVYPGTVEVWSRSFGDDLYCLTAGVRA